MKILLLNQAFYPDPVATAQHTMDLALFLKENGCEVTVVSGRRGYSDRQRIYAKQERVSGIEIHRVHSTGLGKKNLFTRLIDALTFDALLLWKLLRLPRHDVTISFTSPPLIGVFGTLFSIVRGGRSVQWLMDINPDAAMAVGYLKSRSWLGRALTWIFEFTLKESSHIVVLDRWMKDRVLGHGARQEQLLIVPPWTLDEEHLLISRFEENQFIKEFSLDNKFIILYSGNHSIVHPLDTLLEAAVRLAHDRDILFLFIGSGLRKTDVRSYVEKYRLTNVLQLPYQPRDILDQSLSSANLHVVVMGNRVSGLVHTSKIYGVLSTGKPYLFIGPRGSHVGDILSECPYGFHVEHGEVESLVEIIGRARQLTLEELRIFKENNTRYVTTHFSAQKSMSLFAKTVLNIGASIPTSEISYNSSCVMVPK